MFKLAVSALECSMTEFLCNMRTVPDTEFKKYAIHARIFTEAILQQTSVETYTNMLNAERVQELPPIFKGALYFWIIAHAQVEYLFALLQTEQEYAGVIHVLAQEEVQIPSTFLCTSLIQYITSFAAITKYPRTPLFDTVHKYLTRLSLSQSLPANFATFVKEYSNNTKLKEYSSASMFGAGFVPKKRKSVRPVTFGDSDSETEDEHESSVDKSNAPSPAAVKHPKQPVPIRQTYGLIDKYMTNYTIFPSPTGSSTSRELMTHMHTVMPETQYIGITSLARYLTNRRYPTRTHQPKKYQTIWAIAIKRDAA